MKVKFSYEIHAAHWNDDADQDGITRENLFRSIHGHNWLIEVTIEADRDANGLTVDEVRVRESVMDFHCCFLPDHPRIKAVREAGQFGDGYAGATEDVAEAVANGVSELISYGRVTARVYETSTIFAEFIRAT